MIKRMMERMRYEVLREEDDWEERMPLLPEKEEEEDALPLIIFPEIWRRQLLLIEPPSAEAFLIKCLLPPPEIRMSSPLMPVTATAGPRMMPLTTAAPTSPRRRRSLIGRFVDAVADSARLVTATVAGNPGNSPANIVGCDSCAFVNAARDNEDDYDTGKCAVGSIQTYCQNCRRYHRALVPIQEE